ncbi:hypothetical protein BpHYR1_023007 [Brachionus plicatilis]|uniref:Uncharacterized protein n=1 Tax=Brachionus plicatilis TaxID=10195 RepID=A0A3M7QEC3_BRAPC|nr:hypothetical protein BpHYR1_023007 [Brachionus plicatilis]
MINQKRIDYIFVLSHSSKQLSVIFTFHMVSVCITTLSGLEPDKMDDKWFKTKYYVLNTLMYCFSTIFEQLAPNTGNVQLYRDLNHLNNDK